MEDGLWISECSYRGEMFIVINARRTVFFSLSGGEENKMRNTLWSMLTMEICIFLLMAFAMGFANGVIENMLFLFLDDLGSTKTLMGLTITVCCHMQCVKQEEKDPSRKCCTFLFISSNTQIPHKFAALIW